MNSNPLLIRKSSDKWLGEVSSSNDYEAFEGMFYGDRAALVKLRNFYKKGFKTIRMICKYWDSRMTDDEVSSFTSSVERTSQIFADQELTGKSSEMAVVASAMSRYFLGDEWLVTASEFQQVSKQYGIFGE